MFIFSRIAGFLIDALMQLFNNNYIITLCFFAVIIRAVTMPISIAGQKMSAKYKRLKPQIEEIKDSGADVHEVERRLTELYDKHGVKTVNFLAGPLSSLLNFLVLVGFIKAIYQPLTYVLRLSAEEIATLAGLYNTASQTSILSAFIQNPSLAATAIPFEDYNSLFAFAMGVTKSGWDLSQIPTAQYLLWLPILTLVVYLVKECFSVFQAWFFTRTMPTFTIVMSAVSILFTAWFAFSLPAGMCVYWTAGAVVSLAIKIFMFFRKYKREKHSRLEKIGNIYADKEMKSSTKRSA